MASSTRLKWLKAGSVIGAMLMFSPFIGLAGTVYGMTRAFETLGANGITDPHALGKAVGETLAATVAGIVIAIPGLGLFLSCYLPYRSEKKKAAIAPHSSQV